LTILFYGFLSIEEPCANHASIHPAWSNTLTLDTWGREPWEELTPEVSDLAPPVANQPSLY